MRGLCWINGILSYQPQLSVHDRGLLIADGLFETIRVEQGEVLDFASHFERLRAGLIAFNISISYSKEELLVAAQLLIEKVELGGKVGRLRLTVTRGVPQNGASVFMTLVPYVESTLPLQLVLTDVVRVAGNPSSRFKTLAYTDNFFAQRLVEKQGGNRIAVLLNQWGRVACASIGNVFVKIKDEWITPPVDEGALPGITRGKLLAAGELDGIPVREGEVQVEAFLQGEVLLTNVLRGIERGICAPHRRST